MRYGQVCRASVLTVLSVVALVAPAHAASTSFSSSFEANDPQPTWTNTAESSSGVTVTDLDGNRFYVGQSS